MNALILWIRIIGALLPLLYASISDLRTRMVKHELTWLIMIIVGSIAAILEAILFQDLRILLDLAINVGLSFAVAFLLFYAGLFGGADGKALIGIAFLFPRPPSIVLGWGFRPLLPFFFLTILSNALLLTVLVPLALVIRNFADYISNRDLFSGLENEPFWKKALTIFIGFRTNFPPPPHVYPLLNIEEVNGVLTPQLKLFNKISDESEESDDTNLQTIKEFLYQNEKTKIKRLWVSPGIPFLIPVTLGFLVALIIGDLLLLILNILIP
ncbi:MAG: A24 family peptidase C-terminal domain-containing protein [Promethearchaeota archaeon]